MITKWKQPLTFGLGLAVACTLESILKDNEWYYWQVHT